MKQERKKEYGKTTEEREIEMQEGIKKKESKNEEKKNKDSNIWPDGTGMLNYSYVI